MSEGGKRDALYSGRLSWIWCVTRGGSMLTHEGPVHDTIEKVREYYGKILKSSADLQTSACCAAEALPPHIRPFLNHIHPETRDRFYGCGSPLPVDLKGLTVLDLGCGSGRDSYLLSQLVGESGRVIGIDMTDS